MSKQPITHLVIDTSSTDEHYSGDCDFALVPMTAEYISYLLAYMDEVAQLHRADDSVYDLELWDGSCSYFQFNDKLEEIRDVDGNLAIDVPRGEPVLLTGDPGFSEDDFQRVECQTVQILSEDVWWTAYVKHTNIRIESAHVEKRTLLRILRSLGGDWKHRGNPRLKPIPPAVRRIHDLLYLDMKNGREFYNLTIMRTAGLCGVSFSLWLESPVLLAIQGLGNRDVLRIIMASTYCPCGRKDGDHVGESIRGQMGTRQDARKPDRRRLGAVRRVPDRSRPHDQHST